MDIGSPKPGWRPLSSHADVWEGPLSGKGTSTRPDTEGSGETHGSGSIDAPLKLAAHAARGLHMAELFDQAEEPEEASLAVATDATAVAIALDRARRRGNKPVAGDEQVDRFLSKQEGLIDDQRAHLHEQMTCPSRRCS
jgi:hypothetical protein